MLVSKTFITQTFENISPFEVQPPSPGFGKIPDPKPCLQQLKPIKAKLQIRKWIVMNRKSRLINSNEKFIDYIFYIFKAKK